VRRKTEQTDKFAVTDDAGNVDLAYEFTDFLFDDGGGEWVKAGLRAFKLSNGDALNRIDDETYHWVRGNKQLRRLHR
jgi:hypothetical protein